MVMNFLHGLRQQESAFLLCLLLLGGSGLSSLALALEPVPSVSPEPPPPSPSPKFLLTELNITGNQLIGTDVLMGLACCVVGGLVDLPELERIAGLITDLYRQEGYTVASAFIPSQDISGGKVTILVLEGAVSDVVVTGNVLYSSTFIERRFAPVLADKALKNATLERTLLLLNETPGLKVSANLEPGAEVGTTRITASVKDQPANAPSALAKRPVHLSFGYNNFDFRPVSPSRFDLGVEVGNILLDGSLLSYRATMGEKPDLILFQSGVYEVPINNNGTKLVLSGSHGHFDVTGALAQLGIKDKMQTVDVSMTHPLIKRRLTTLLVEVGFAAKDNQLFLVNEKFTDDRLRMVKLGLNGDWLDSTGRSFLSAYGYQGIGHALGGMGDHDPMVSRQGADNRFTKGVLMGGRVQAITQEQFLNLRGNGQVSTGPLPFTERFLLGGMGGMGPVRGYDWVDQNLVDEGYAVSAEYWVPALIPQQVNEAFGWLFGKGDLNLGSYMQFLAFIDHGAGRSRAPTVGERRTYDLTGAGVGTRVNLPYYSTALSFDVGFPVGARPSSGGDNPVFYIQLSGKY